ncbi:NADP-dependent oxidoreductase [Pyxidicoccus fallax]|uniref:NADP-dependent oxidoreductase n=1 Tax=Pyxidicoccus fallax TaxID=394095 RepID=A0A848LFV5_9BACT|nr:NADP-dependent oxidoreductase [Pyxidicoccus fallax]NMO15895.1 NADP-dependent oxidoreductase [Pyxidicoccus fallax]NPC81331.1 NADP-dependent oxidoreductase [Pyxidicoccus fallax]
MPQRDTVNRRVVLAARPRGLPTSRDFRLEEAAVPTPKEGEVLLRTLYLSLDPYMRNVMEEIGPVYAPSVPLDAPMPGGTVNRVVASRNPRFRTGELVLGNAGWQDYALSDGQDLVPLGEMAQPSQALGGLGMPGFTAHVGLLDIGQPKPGETVVVAAATGAVGSAVGQIAKLKGARVVGIAGGADKCRYAVEELGFDVCLDRRDSRLAERLAAACPKGIDVYFENVGGDVFDAVLPLLNVGARVPVCGVIAHYNEQTPPPGPNRLPLWMSTVLQKRIRVQGFVILDHYGERFDAFRREMGQWVDAGRVKLREDRADGLENAPSAFIGLLEGRNFGKLVVRVADE